jgi:sugar lactone lactonase YvrE
MMRSPFKCVLDIKASLGECPTWSVDEQLLYWVDINAPSLNRFEPLTGRNIAWPMPEAIGCFGLREGAQFVAALRSGIWLIGPDGRPKRKIAAVPYDPAHHRFNDGRIDVRGRFWVGSMNENRDAPTGGLYRLDPNSALVPVVSEITISNGLAWSPDSRTMYHADTPTRTINAWDFDPLTGAIANRRVFKQFSAETDRPDGAAVDCDGFYWSALYRGGKVVRLSPRGDIVAEFPLQAMCPTMCAFGGPDLRTLYVTTARQLRNAEELSRLPQSGGIFAMRVDVPGIPEPKFSG